MIRQVILASVAIASLTSAAVAQTSSAQTQTITPTAQAPPPAPPASWNNTSQQALETAQSGTAVPWQNPDGSSGGVITPSPAFQNAAGQPCREFQQSIMVNGQAEEAFGTACRQPDGTWRLQPAPPATASAPPAVGDQSQPAVAYVLPPAYYAYYYPEPFYAPLFFGFGCCFGHFHGGFHGHGGFHHH
jgi:hypothetical protein